MFHDFSNNDKLTLNISIWINATLQHTKVTNSIPYTTLQILGLTFIKPRSSAEGLLKKHGLLGTWYILKPTSWGFLCSTSHIPSHLADNFGNCPVLLDHWTLHVHKAYKTKHLKLWMNHETLRPWPHCPKDLNWHPYHHVSNVHLFWWDSISLASRNLLAQVVKDHNISLISCIRLHSKWYFCMFLVMSPFPPRPPSSTPSSAYSPRVQSLHWDMPAFALATGNGKPWPGRTRQVLKLVN